MRLRPSVTGALLAFVLVAIAGIVVKNVQRSHQAKVARAEPQQTAEAAPTAADRVDPQEPAPATIPTAVPAAQVAAPATPAPATPPRAHTRSAVPAPRPTAPRREVRVTYFHTTTRCLSCYKIEALSEAAVSANFAAALAKGDLVWRTVNIDEPGNGHYVDDYKLFTKSVIVSEVIGDREVRFKNLDRVWKLLGDEQGFARYIVDEVGAFVGNS